MNQLKEQLEERTRILQADIKTQQQELHDIKEKLHLANLQVTYPQTLQVSKQKAVCFSFHEISFRKWATSNF